jgi:HSP20 family protein
MAIQRWDPVRDLVEMQQKINRLFEETFSRSSGAEGVDSVGAAGWRPATDLIEEADRYVLRADLPGVAAGNVEVRIENGSLFLRGERKMDGNVPTESYLRVERPYGHFAVKVALAPNVDTTSVRASHKNGVIEVVLPKRKAETTSRVEVTSGGSTEA